MVTMVGFLVFTALDHQWSLSVSTFFSSVRLQHIPKKSLFHHISQKLKKTNICQDLPHRHQNSTKMSHPDAPSPWNAPRDGTWHVARWPLRPSWLPEMWGPNGPKAMQKKKKNEMVETKIYRIDENCHEFKKCIV